MAFGIQETKQRKGRGHTRCPQCAPPMRLILLLHALTHVQAVLDILTGLKMLGAFWVADVLSESM